MPPHTTPHKTDSTAPPVAVDSLTISLIVSAFVHEVNNPLAFIFSNIEFIQEKILKLKRLDSSPPLNNEDLSDAFDDISYGINKIKDVMNDLRNCFHINQQEIQESVSLSDMIDLCLISMRHYSREQIKITKDVHETLKAYGVKFQILYSIMQTLQGLLGSPKDQGQEHSLSIRGYQDKGSIFLEMTAYSTSDGQMPDKKAGILITFDAFS